MNEAPLFTVGVVADTHVPDRAPSLPPGLTEALRSAGVGHILHAGDVCAQRVLDELGEVAPVSAARGNRDFLFAPALPMALELEFFGVRLGLMHGHGGIRQYWMDKLSYLVQGYRVERYRRVAEQSLPRANVWIYGHSHRPENRWMDGHLVFNPGAVVGFQFGPFDLPPSYGLLRIYSGGRVEGQVQALEGIGLRRGAWVGVIRG